MAGDFLHLEKDIRLLNEHADILHFDVMDGSLVPNLSFGFPIMEAVAPIATIPMDVHLMIVNPDKYIPRFAKAELPSIQTYRWKGFSLILKKRISSW